MRESILKNEYITNKSQVIDILKNKTFDLKYKGKKKMYDKDKNYMYAYTLTINEQVFDYYEGLGHEPMNPTNKYDKIISALHCLLLDSDVMSWFKSIDNFMLEYGYLDYGDALQVFQKCKDTSFKLSKIFPKNELDFLRENINL